MTASRPIVTLAKIFDYSIHFYGFYDGIVVLDISKTSPSKPNTYNSNLYNTTIELLTSTVIEK